MMRQQTHQEIDSVLKRVDEVRSLLSLTPHEYSSLDDQSLLARLCLELAETLESTHRKLIETNTKLSVLGEMAEGMLSAVRPEEAITTICSYMLRVLEMQEVGLWFTSRELGTFQGTWSRLGEGGVDSIEHSFCPAALRGTARSALWHLQSTLVGAEELKTQLHLPLSGEGGAIALVPLVSSRQWLPCKEVKRCIRQDCRAYFGKSGFCWEAPSTLCLHEKGFDLSRREEFCFRCDVFPLLGLLAVAKETSGQLSPSELAMLESVAYNISRMLESSRLYGDLEVGEELRQSILDSMGECLVATDLSGQVIAFNRMAGILTGFDVDEVVGTTLDFLTPTECRDESPMLRALRHGIEQSCVETIVMRRSGGSVPVKMTTRLLREDAGSVKGVIATFSDLRPARKLEESMRRLDRLAALGRFASSVAHELRNPLTGIAAGIQYMARQFGESGPDVDNVRFLLREIARLERIVQDLLRITHPQELILSEIRIEDVVERALKSLGPSIQSRTVSLDLSLSGEIPAVTVDVDQMQQVFINLITNAYEATSEGGSVSIEIRGSEDGGGEQCSSLAVTVTDSGVGIDGANLDHIFEPFFTTKPAGTGLGLYITHDIVKRHGGEITVRSEPSKGASFTVQLPIVANLGQERGDNA
ncbi:MAG: ATP-binding protein [Candidatus Eisenbacteria bacterium]|nr:ATP-binding protein [Candidatus Eisenbacteria bacterium]